MESENPPIFEGDFSTMWRLGLRKPLWHLTWDWWWWLVMLDDDEHPCGKQLMVLWSTKDNDRVEVNGFSWMPKGRPGKDDQGGMAIDDQHPRWPAKGKGDGGGAVVPLLPDDLSMGLNSDKSAFWINLSGDKT